MYLMVKNKDFSYDASVFILRTNFGIIKLYFIINDLIFLFSKHLYYLELGGLELQPQLCPFVHWDLHVPGFRSCNRFDSTDPTQCGGGKVLYH